MRSAYIISVLVIILAGCSSLPVTPPVDPDNSPGDLLLSSHVSWGKWAISIDPENEIATAVPVRENSAHVNVTGFIEPPSCGDCLQILFTGWDPVERIVDVTVVLKNPTTFDAYDVKAVISDYDTKEFLEPDAYCDFYTDDSTWDPYYTFATDEEDNFFGNGESHAIGLQLYFPFGATGNATVTVDASWPGPQEEPWRLNNIVVAGPLQNNFYNHISFTCHIWDHQDDVDVVFAALPPVGPVDVPMSDDSNHKDYLPGDDIWGLDEIKTSASPGIYDIWIRARSLASPHFTYQKLQIEVILPVPNPPPLYVCSMMHAEEQDIYLNEAIFLEYADTLRALMNLFNNHGAKIALQPDWTFIEGAMNFDPTLLTDFQDSGHGVDTHAHETEYDLAYVHNLLDSAGVQDTIIANGGFNQTYGDDGNWAAYIAHFVTGDSQQMFLAANAYKDPSTQKVDSLYTPIRPSTTGDWMIHDPQGPLVYIPGAPENGVTGAHPQFFTLLPDAVEYALAGRIPGKVNCFYWHDQVGNYDGSPLADSRIAFWGQLFADYFDDKVSDGDIVWANFNEMYQAYIDWEDS